MKKSSKLLTLVVAAALFIALGTGIAFAYNSGYRSGAATPPPPSAGAYVAPVTTAEVAVSPGLSPVLPGQTTPTNAPSTGLTSITCGSPLPIAGH
jgi:hypothetical protein